MTKVDDWRDRVAQAKKDHEDLHRAAEGLAKRRAAAKAMLRALRGMVERPLGDEAALAAEREARAAIAQAENAGITTEEDK